MQELTASSSILIERLATKLANVRLLRKHKESGKNSAYIKETETKKEGANDLNEFEAGQTNIRVACCYSEQDTWVSETLFPILQAREDIELVKSRELGLPMLTAIVKQLDGCGRILIVISKNYLNKTEWRYEVNRTLSQGMEQKRSSVIPIVLDGCKMPSELSYIIALSANDDDFTNCLLAAIYAETT